MTPAAVAAFARRGVEKGLLLQGVPITFRGSQILVRISPAPPKVSLESGGIRERQLWRVRFPLSVQPPPSELEQFTASDGRLFVITNPIAATGAPSAAEHVTEAWCQ